MRASRVAEFERATQRHAMVLSLRAGGVGLNLTSASHVFHFDRWWNPAVEAQAEDRTYRIGQERPVHVMPISAVTRLRSALKKFSLKNVPYSPISLMPWKWACCGVWTLTSS